MREGMSPDFFYYCTKVWILHCQSSKGPFTEDRLGEFPRARPKGTPKGGGLHFTVHPESSTGRTDSPYTPWGKYGMFCVLENTLG